MQTWAQIKRGHAWLGKGGARRVKPAAGGRTSQLSAAGRGWGVKPRQAGAHSARAGVGTMPAHLLNERAGYVDKVPSVENGVPTGHEGVMGDVQGASEVASLNQERLAGRVVRVSMGDVIQMPDGTAQQVSVDVYGRYVMVWVVSDASAPGYGG